jgi:thiamine pyrophosphate-dependent acetolactate synthase large subunit-like protein
MPADLVELARPFVKCDYNGPCAWRVVDEHSILRLLRRAIKSAATQPTGPVLLVLPMDVLERECSEHVVPTTIPDTQVAASPAALEKAAELLLEAQCPTILMGDGVAAACAVVELTALAECLGAIVYGANNSEVNMSACHPLYGGDTGHLFGAYPDASEQRSGGKLARRFTDRRATPTPDESPMQHSQEDGFSGSTDAWAHGQRPSTPFPLQ